MRCLDDWRCFRDVLDRRGRRVAGVERLIDVCSPRGEDGLDASERLGRQRWTEPSDQGVEVELLALNPGGAEPAATGHLL